MHLPRYRRDSPATVEHIPTSDGGTVISITRGRMAAEQLGVLRPNQVHAVVLHPDGSYEDLGVSRNLRTTVGLDWQANLMGGVLGIGDNTATASSATSLTKAAAGWTVDLYKGMRVVADNGTAAPVYGNIGTNSATVLTVDQWWNADDTLGTTASATGHFYILGEGAARFIGLTTDASAAASGDTALTSEATTNGLTRALGLYAHSNGVASYTLAKTFTASGTFTAVHRAGLFTASTNAAGGIMVFETVLNADASLVSGDSLAVTWTVNI